MVTVWSSLVGYAFFYSEYSRMYVRLFRAFHLIDLIVKLLHYLD